MPSEPTAFFLPFFVFAFMSSTAICYLNNTGVALLQRQCYEDATQVLSDATRLLRDALLDEQQDLEEYAPALRFANQALADASSKPVDKTLQVILPEQIATEQKVAVRMLRWDESSTCPVLYNLSLAHQLAGLDEKAFCLYRLCLADLDESSYFGAVLKEKCLWALLNLAPVLGLWEHCAGYALQLGQAARDESGDSLSSSTHTASAA